MRYSISIYKIQIKGQRKRYAWAVDVEDYGVNGMVEVGDSFYIFNARRAAQRAMKRHSEGLTKVTEVEYREFDV